MCALAKIRAKEGLLRLLIVNSSILAALYMTADNFDGEIWVILVALGASGISESIRFKKDI